MKTEAAPPLVVRGKDAWLELEDGRSVLDCISSWWVTLHGHGNETIAKAIYEQALKLEQVIFAGFTHEPAETLAQRLLEHLPTNLKRVFFSDNGSTAVEVALKMSLQYWSNRGQTSRHKFIGFEHGYHGDTVGAMSIGGTSKFFQPYASFLFPIDTVPFPETWQGDDGVQDKEQSSIAALESLLVNGDHYAGIFIEPLVQGAGGMRMCRPEFLQTLEKCAKQHGLLIIYDEVMTGFGRTGDWFACIKAHTSPDIICLSKGISAGFLPLALTIASDEIYESFLGDDLQKALFHSHSYMGNPLACAAANASLTLLEESPQRFSSMESLHQELIDKWIKTAPNLERARTCGTIAAFDLTIDSNPGYYNTISRELRKSFLERGFLMRPLGNTIYLLPPYCITARELESAYQAIHEIVTSLENSGCH